MKKVYKKILILIISIIAIFLIQGKVQAASFGYQPQAYMISPDILCMNYNKALKFTANGTIETTMNFSESSAGTPEQSTAYAAWMGTGDGPGLQNVVWASRQWGNSSNVLEASAASQSTAGSSNTVEARSYQYGTVYYKIFSQVGNNLFTLSKGDLRVMVNQSSGTYTVGPYYLKANAGDAEAKQILYNEIVGSGNQGFSEGSRFAKFSGIGGINGGNAKFIGSSGSQIPFPDFVNETPFYIEFKPNNGGDISNTGKLTIQIDFISSMSGSTTKYLSQSLDFYNLTYTYEGSTRTRVTREDPVYDWVWKEVQTDKWDWAYVQVGTETVFDHWEFTNIHGYVTVVSTKEGKSWKVPINYSGTVTHSDENDTDLDDEEFTNLVTTNPFTVSDSNASGITNYIQPMIRVYGCTPNWSSWSDSIEGQRIDMYIGGYVWQEISDLNKESKMNGRFDSGSESKFGGISVELYDANTGKLVGSTTTDSNGAYGFKKLNPLHKYYVKFTYNGMVYQDTYYKNDLSGGYSTAKERDNERESFNNKFLNISSSPNNYQINGNWYKAYSYYEKIKDSNGNFISYNNGQANTADNAGSFRFCDALDIFQKLAVLNRNYNSSNQDTMDNTYTNINTTEKTYAQIESTFKNELAKLGVPTSEQNNIWTYINHCLLSSYTVNYPEQNKFTLLDVNNPQGGSTIGFDNLYTPSRDQSRNVDFGLYLRETADLALQKDVYKTTVIVNGKTQEYMYNKKDANIDDDGAWNITVRVGDYLYNGTHNYTREIRKSEYLYDGSIYGANGGTDAKDLQVYVTYRIVVRNQSQSYDTVINEIVDYYDSNEYEYIANNPIIQENTYVGNRAAEKKANLNVSTNSTLNNGKADTTLTNYYKSLYLSGITDDNGNSKISANGGMAYIYLTFKVKTHVDENGMDGRVQMDVDVLTGKEKGVGKRNLAEINGYATYYKENRNNNPAKIPDYLDGNNNTIDKDVSGKPAGTIDRDSSVGNLSSQDLNSNGDLIITDNPLTNRTEDDTDKAPNIKLVFPQNDNEERTFTGYVYEDERNQASDSAVVGNGVWDSNETKINGVTVQLVELIQEVDPNNVGRPTGNYLGEYVWYAKKYENGTWVDVNSTADSGSIRYYSGQKGTVSPIITGPGATAIGGYEITEDGQYAFKGIPAGDYFIRFIYGDTTQTVLTSSDGEGKEVVNLLNANGITAEVNGEKGFISTNGLNAKSYNGQDYKSTTYQVGVNQNTSYNGVNGFTNYDKQNYNITTPNNKTSDYVWRRESNVDGKDKSVMYYYDIGESATKSGISDAKDVKNIRNNSDNYSKGISGVDTEDHQTLQNNRSEVLVSGLKVGTKQDANEQVNMIKELMDNTAGVSQTGVINTEIEYNKKRTEGQDANNGMSYVIEDIDLGLSERPIAQLKMNKEVSNLKITLADGTILFDTGKTVSNLPYAKHTGHSQTYQGVPNNSSPAYRLISVTIGPNSESVPELIQTYMDEELMYGARIELMYTFKVTNIGEVDYLDNQFYYTGKTNNTGANNISKTTADTVIDYVSNNLQFLPTNSNNTDWSIRTVGELIKSDNNGSLAGDDTDLVNSKYETVLNTYNAIVTTKALGNEDLYPEKTGLEKSSTETHMMLSSTLTPDSGDDSMVYNNLSEIVQVSNDKGRRLKFSVVGNQPMADQSKGPGDPTIPEQGIYTKADLVTPTEVDSDSSQQVLILPPTGANRNYTLWIILGLSIAILIGGSVILIRKKVLKK